MLSVPLWGLAVILLAWAASVPKQQYQQGDGHRQKPDQANQGDRPPPPKKKANDNSVG